MTEQHERNARCFNAGADARLRGRPLESCPHRDDSNMSATWRLGWLDCNRYWGDEVRRRWFFHPLPPVEARP